MGASWTRGPLALTAVVADVFDTDWESPEFYYESRLAPGEPVIEDFPFTPGIPRS